MLELDEDPKNLRALMIAGRAFLDLKRPGLAEVVLRRAVQISPRDTLLLSYLGLALNMSHQPELAEEVMRLTLSIDPRHPIALDAMSLIKINQADPLGAIRYANKSLAAKEDINIAQNAGFAYLLNADYKQGWPLYNLGIGNDSDRKERFYQNENRWDGTKGLTVVAFGEQGIGDEIQFASAIPDLLKDCKVIIECDHRLEGLFKRSFDCPVFGTRYREATWVDDFKIDAHVAFSSLMEFYRNKKEDFPKTPYLKADPERRKWWRAVLDQYPGRKIGIAWKAGIPITGKKKRSLPLEELLKLKGQDTFISLEHKDPGDCGVLNFSRFINTKDYDDTAALVAELDHVISSTTAIVDLCGALGKSCDVFVPSVPHWKYGFGEMDWYKVNLFRQLPGEQWPKTLRRYASLHRNG